MNISFSYQNGVPDGIEKAEFEKYVSDQFDDLHRFFRHYLNKEPEILVHVSRVKDTFSLSFVLKGPNPVYAHLRGKDLNETAMLLLEKFKSKISRELGKIRKGTITRKRIHQKLRMEDIVPDLIRHREEEDWDAFSHVFGTMLPEIRKFLERRYNEVKGTGVDENTIGNLQELADELYLDIWRNFDKRPADLQEMKEWIYSMADKFVTRKLNFIHSGGEVVNVDNLKRHETEELEENFAWDAEGEIYLSEEFADPSEVLNKYYYHDFFPDKLIFDQYEIEDYNRFIEDFNNLVLQELSKFPVEKRTTFDFYFNEGLSPEEISRIRNMPVREVRRTVNEINSHLTTTLKSWVEANYPKSGEA
jgi:DNA-directed RNA polymerase specialized sigma24 family protein